MNDDDRPRGGYASPPCLAGEIAPDYFDPLAVDPDQARDVARWRKARRHELLAARDALGVAARQAAAAAMGRHLDQLVAELLPEPAGKVIAGYWPIKSEPDLRPWLAAQRDKGVIVALPVVVAKGQPLVFRPWEPGGPMVRGVWNILEPDTTATVTPDLVLAPALGWDDAGYRLGYGGGYYDRTLARHRPPVIGIALAAARLATIFPQPWDIPLAAIVTEAGIAVRNDNGPNA